MKSIPTVKELRQQNFKVRIVHKRFLTDPSKSWHWIDPEIPIPEKEIRAQFNTMSLCSEKGGLTRLELRTPEGLELISEAKCSREDNYWRQYGVKLCIERALKQTQKSFLQKFISEFKAAFRMAFGKNESKKAKI